MIKTSIIVPVYNTNEYLVECFNSIYGQTQDEIEVIAINDGSTDGSLRTLEQIQKKHPELIIYSQINKGLSAARNKGMELATGDFIYFMDSDDCLVPTAMEVCYQYAVEYSLDAFMFDAETFGDISGNHGGLYDRRGVIKDGEIVIRGEEFARKYWLNACCATAWSHYFSAQFLKKYNLKFLEGIFYEDLEFHYKMLPVAERVMYSPRFLYRRRYREGSITCSKFDSRHAKDYLKMLQAVQGQHHGEFIKDVVQERKHRHMCWLFLECQKNGLLNDLCFVEDFFKTAQEIYGHDIDLIQNHCNIEILYQLGSILKDTKISTYLYRNIIKRRKEIFDRICKELFCRREKDYVGIYGIGNYAKQFMDEYVEQYGDKREKIIFIESNIKSGETKFRGYNVSNVNDISSMPLECIVIASSRYEQEIHQTIKDKYDNRFRIICLKSDLHYGI